MNAEVKKVILIESAKVHSTVCKKKSRVVDDVDIDNDDNDDDNNVDINVVQHSRLTRRQSKPVFWWQQFRKNLRLSWKRVQSRAGQGSSSRSCRVRVRRRTNFLTLTFLE